MHDLCLTPSLAAALARSASSPNQPDTEAPSIPADDSFSQSRRVIDSRNMVMVPCVTVGADLPVCPSPRQTGRSAPTSVIRHELGAVEQRPQHTRVAPGRVVL